MTYVDAYFAEQNEQPDFRLSESDIDDIQNELDESSNDEEDPDIFFFTKCMPRPKNKNTM